MARTEFMAALNQVASERGIEVEEVLETLQHALLAAYKKDYDGADVSLQAAIDQETGTVRIFKDEQDVTPAGFGRIAAQTAKQVILQGVRESEKTAILQEYSKKVGSVISGMIQRREGAVYMVDIGRTTAVFPPEEWVSIEHYQLNQRLKFYLKEIRQHQNRSEIVVSRAAPELVLGLFELEVPEIANETVEIIAIAREAGNRTKIAVVSHQEGVDPVGSCVGQRGVRVQAITTELSNEKIDIILGSDDPAGLVKNALAPAEVKKVTLDKASQSAFVEVAEDQLSLAIGKEGQNVRLAAKLTGFRIDIKGAGKTPEPQDLGKLSRRTQTALQKASITAVAKLKNLSLEEISQTKGIGPKALGEIKLLLGED